MLTNQGRIYYTGKSSALGHKQPCPNGQWNELAITKASKFVQCAVGHEGGHSLLLSEDGAVYFVGTVIFLKSIFKYLNCKFLYGAICRILTPKFFCKI